MGISGKVYIVPNKERRSWELWVENDGGEKFGVTHNIFPNAKSEVDRHDDHKSWGHGLPVAPGKATMLEFRENARYHGQPITERSVVRLGIRQHAYKTVQFPKLDGEEIVELDLKDFHWYAGSAANAHNTTTKGSGNSMEHWGSRAANKMKQNQDRSVLATRIAALRQQSHSGILVEGKVSVTAVPDEHGAISHWNVRFDNEGETPFIGTVAFSQAKGKRDGLGLESMPVANKGSAAVQRIEAMGNYGVVAKPGARLRLGVRGYGYLEQPLPDRGEEVFPIAHFRVDTSKSNEEWFDAAKVTEKRAEKLNRVQFFEGGKAINDEIKPVTHRGKDARTRADFDPPRAVVTHVPAEGEQPEGWKVVLTSRMPPEDELGPVGFVATLKLGRTGYDAKAIPPKKLEAPDEAKEWFIPRGLKIREWGAEPGTELVIGTRGLGWFAAIPLPAEGAVDSAEEPGVFGFREDQFNRANLGRDFTNKCKD